MLLSFAFLYFLAFAALIISIFYIINSDQNETTPNEPSKLIYKESVQSEIVSTPETKEVKTKLPVKKQVLVEVCNLIDGCPVVKGICQGCVQEKKWITE